MAQANPFKSDEFVLSLVSVNASLKVIIASIKREIKISQKRQRENLGVFKKQFFGVKKIEVFRMEDEEG